MNVLVDILWEEFFGRKTLFKRYERKQIEFKKITKIHKFPISTSYEY